MVRGVGLVVLDRKATALEKIPCSVRESDLDHRIAAAVCDEHRQLPAIG